MRTRLLILIVLFAAFIFVVASSQPAAAQSTYPDLNSIAADETTGAHAAITQNVSAHPLKGEQRLLRQGCENLPFGQKPAHQATSDAGTDDCYTFSGTAGNVIRVRVSKLSGTLHPRIEVTNPDGSDLCEAVGELTCTLVQNGVHTILVKSSSAITYKIYLQRWPNPTNCTPLTFGSRPAHSDSYDFGDVNCFTFIAKAGDVIFVRNTRLSGTLYPQVELVSKDGTKICSSIGDLTCTLVQTGLQTVLVKSTASGTHKIYIQRLNNAARCTSLNFGASRTASYTFGDVHCYKFNGPINATVRIRVTKLSGALSPQIDLVSPNGIKLCNGTGELTCTLVQTGYHTVLVKSTDSGSYRIALSCLSGGCQVPAAPILKLPRNNSTVTNSKPRFCWNSVPGAAQYRLQVDNNPDFSSPVIDVTISSLCFNSPSALADRTYYWHVRARNSAGLWGSWSARWSFKLDAMP